MYRKCLALILALLLGSVTQALAANPSDCQQGTGAAACALASGTTAGGQVISPVKITELTSGTSFTTSSGYNHQLVLMFGSGGGGGGCSTTTNAAGGGGGTGAGCMCYTAVAANTPVTYSLATGGTVGTSGGTPTAGNAGTGSTTWGTGTSQCACVGTNGRGGGAGGASPGSNGGGGAVTGGSSQLEYGVVAGLGGFSGNGTSDATAVGGLGGRGAACSGGVQTAAPDAGGDGKIVVIELP